MENKQEINAWEDGIGFTIEREFFEKNKIKNIDDIHIVKFFMDGTMRIYYNNFNEECVYEKVRGKWKFKFKIDQQLDF